MAILLAGGILIFASLMASAALWFREPAEIGGNSTGPDARLSRQTAAGQLEAELFLEPGLTWQLDIHVAPEVSSVGQDRPTVILEMADMEMGRGEPPLQLGAAGEFDAEGQVPMPGRWRFQVGVQDELLDMVVSVPGEEEN